MNKLYGLAPGLPELMLKLLSSWLVAWLGWAPCMLDVSMPEHWWAWFILYNPNAQNCTRHDQSPRLPVQRVPQHHLYMPSFKEASNTAGLFRFFQSCIHVCL